MNTVLAVSLQWRMQDLGGGVSTRGYGGAL